MGITLLSIWKFRCEKKGSRRYFRFLPREIFFFHRESSAKDSIQRCVHIRYSASITVIYVFWRPHKDIICYNEFHYDVKWIIQVFRSKIYANVFDWKIYANDFDEAKGTSGGLNGWIKCTKYRWHISQFAPRNYS